MMNLLRTWLFSCAFLLAHSAFAQTIVIAKPVSDARGFVAFQVTQIVRNEGIWEHPIEMGQLIYPNKMAKAHPIMRFGEAVMILFRTPDAITQWEGLNIHNGCIPALKGEPVEELVKKIEASPAWKPPANSEKKPKKEEYGICPVCKQRHLRLPSP